MRAILFWRMIRLLLAVCAALHFSGSIAGAADSEPTPKAARDMSKIPDEYIREAFAFNESCKADFSLAEYYNCDCLAVKYLDERIENPHRSASSIRMAINDECADAVGAAGHYYQKCMDSDLMAGDMPRQQFCTCFGNTYANLYKLYKASPSSKVFVQLQAQALITCRNPEIGRKLYPYTPPPAQ